MYVGLRIEWLLALSDF